MTETALIVAEVAFLVILYLFVWAVVRSSSKAVGRSAPAAPVAEPLPAPERRSPARVEAAPPPAATPAPPAPPAPAPEPTLDVPSVEPPAGAVAPDGDAPEARITAARERVRGAGFDLSSNIHPRIVVQRSPDLPQGREIPLEGGITIGRSDSSDLSVGDAFVSHMHARILRRGSYYFVQDLGSTNGTYLNDARVEGDAQLKVRDLLRVGETVLRYEE